MTLDQILLLICVIAITFLLITIILLNNKIVSLETGVLRKNEDEGKNLDKLKKEIIEEIKESENDIKTHVDSQSLIVLNDIDNSRNAEELRLENIRKTVSEQLINISNTNEKKLEEMRQTVDEKLKETLENRLNESFKLVSERLELVHKGLGEMQSLAAGVGDLKKVLSNTKTRGILGEVQLSAILKEIMNSTQYDENVATVPFSNERVEFAIKLPGNNGDFIYMPIDAKFPAETYVKLVDAIEEGDKALIEESRKNLINRLKQEAKDISNKYIHVPETTEFAIMFLPTEGLYSECCNLGMMEELQRQYHITIAGPSTMAALLNSLQMGFKTLAIQERSNEVWKILGSVKSEFGKFEDVLSAVQKNLQKSSDDLDRLVGTRTRQINSKLKSVEANNIPLYVKDVIEIEE